MFNRLLELTVEELERALELFDIDSAKEELYERAADQGHFYQYVNIEHSCGHGDIKQLYYWNESQLRLKLDYYKTEECLVCKLEKMNDSQG